MAPNALTASDGGQAPAATATVRPWVVGGPPRGGKTTLVDALSRLDGPYAALHVEGLLANYLDEPGDPGACLRRYLERPRYLDGARTRSMAPIETLLPSLDALCAAAREATTPLEAIAAALAADATARGKRGWVVADVYPEFAFARLRRHIPNLGLFALFRDPRESLCALVYWRSYPRRASDANRRLRHGLVMWCLSAAVVGHLSATYPEAIRRVTIAGTAPRDPALIAAYAEVFGVDAAALATLLPPESHFSLLDDGTFRAPDGSRAEMLSEREQALITAVAAPWLTALGFPVVGRRGAGGASVLALRAFVAIVRGVARLSPRLAKAMVDAAFFPGAALRRLATRARSRLRRGPASRP